MVAGDPAAAGPGSASARTIVRSAATAVLIAWSLRLIGLVSVLVLARMLTPQDFGKATLATSVVALVDIFSALGLRQALLRIRAPERAHYDTAWTIQLLVLTVLAVVLMAIGPVAARFYEEPALAAIIAILACCFVIDGLGNIGTVDFERHMNFNRDLKMRVSVRLGSFAVTVTMAVILQNFWALVIGMVAQSALYAAASYIFHSYRPRFSLAKRKELLGVSLWMFLASASQTIHSQVEKLVVGRIATRGVLGLYSVSRDLSSIFTEEIATAFNRVTFVTTAQQVGPLSTDAARLSSLLGAYALIVAPLGFGLAATAEEALPILLGSQWTGAAAFLAFIAPGCALYAVHKLVISTLQACGDARAAAFLAMGGASLMVAVTATLAVAGFGPSVVALGGSSAAAAVLVGGTVLLARRAECGVLPLALAVVRPFAAAVFMLVVVRSFETGDMGSFNALALKVPAGIVMFAGAVAALWLGQGRPNGAEKMLLQLARQELARLRTCLLA
jgi:lipopolysaccharide exporter